MSTHNVPVAGAAWAQSLAQTPMKALHKCWQYTWDYNAIPPLHPLPLISQMVDRTPALQFLISKTLRLAIADKRSIQMVDLHTTTIFPSSPCEDNHSFLSLSAYPHAVPWTIKNKSQHQPTPSSDAFFSGRR